MYTKQSINNIYGCELYRDGTEGWFVGRYYNTILKVDFNTSECTKIAKCPEFRDAFAKEGMTWNIVYKDEHCLILLSYRQQSVLIYDLDNHRFENIPIINEITSIGACLVGTIKDGKELIFIHKAGRQIIKFDIKKKKIFEQYDVPHIETGLQQVGYAENSLWFGSGEIGELYGFSDKDNILKKYDIKNLNDTVTTMCYDGCRLWMSGCQNKVYIWEIGKENIEKIVTLPKEFGRYVRDTYIPQIIYDFKRNHLPIFVRMIDLNDYIWCIPYNTDPIICINKNTYEIKTIAIFKFHNADLTLHFSSSYVQYWEIWHDEVYIYFYSEVLNKRFKINTITFEITSDIIFISSQSNKIAFDSAVIECVRKEEIYIGLTTFINSVLNIN